MRRTSLLALAATLPLAALAPRASAQMPGSPVFQNAFANPGLTVALNAADGDGTSLVAIAGAFSPGRLQLSAGLGRLSVTGGDATLAWGLRGAVPVLSLAGGRGGVAPFIGVGGTSRDSTSVLLVPVGVGAGWRFALGSTRALSVYTTGTYLFGRATVGNDRSSGEQLRFAVAADVTIMRRLGLTVGWEGGGEAGQGDAGPGGSVLGAGLSWALR